MYSLLSYLSSRNKDELEEKTSNMKRDVRKELTEEIVSMSGTTQTELEGLEKALQESRDKYEKAKRSEEFVRLRYEGYRRLLQTKRKQLVPVDEEEEDEEEDVEENNDLPAVDTIPNATLDADPECSPIDPLVQNEEGLTPSFDGDDDLTVATEIVPLDISPEERERHLQKLETEEKKLASVEETLESLQKNCTTLEKRISLLEKQRDLILGISKEFNEFLVAAAVTEGRQEAGEVDGNGDEGQDAGDIELLEEGGRKE